MRTGPSSLTAPPTPARDRHVVLLGLLATLVICTAARHPNATGSAPTPAQRAAEIETRLDPNTAEKWELARLPHLGESLAGQIIACRNSADRAPSRPAFAGLADLTQVRGIGDRRLRSFARYLRFPRPDSTSVSPPPARVDTIHAGP